jgi:hypothetical protein
VRHGEGVERKGTGAEHRTSHDHQHFVARGHGHQHQRGNDGDDRGGDHDAATVYTIRQTAERPLRQGTAEHDGTHEHGDLLNVEALVLRKHRA